MWFWTSVKFQELWIQNSCPDLSLVDVWLFYNKVNMQAVKPNFYNLISAPTKSNFATSQGCCYYGSLGSASTPLNFIIAITFQVKVWTTPISPHTMLLLEHNDDKLMPTLFIILPTLVLPESFGWLAFCNWMQWLIWQGGWWAVRVDSRIFKEDHCCKQGNPAVLSSLILTSSAWICSPVEFPTSVSERQEGEIKRSTY